MPYGTNALLNQVSLEDFSMESAIGRLFNRFTDSLRNYSHDFLGLTPIDKLLGDKRRFLKVINETNYVTISPMLVQVPEGFKGNYLEYVTLIRDIMVMETSIEQDILIPFKNILSNIIANPNARFQFDRKAYERILKKSKERSEIQAKLNAMFDNSSNTKASYGNVISRNADWEEVFSITEEIGRLSHTDLRSVKARVEEIVTLLDTVSEMNKEGELTKLHPDLLRHIGELTQASAEGTAFVSVAYYHGRTAFEVLSKLIKDLVKVLG